MWQLMLVTMWGKRNTNTWLVEVQIYTATMEINVVVPQKDGNLSITISSYTSVGHLPKDASYPTTDSCSTMFITALFIIAKL